MRCRRFPAVSLAASLLAASWPPARAQQAARAVPALPSFATPAALPVFQFQPQAQAVLASLLPAPPALPPGLTASNPRIADVPALQAPTLPLAPASLSLDVAASLVEAAHAQPGSEPDWRIVWDGTGRSALPSDLPPGDAASSNRDNVSPAETRLEPSALHTVPAPRAAAALRGASLLGLSPALVKSLPWLKAGGVLGLTWLATKIAARVIDRMARSAGWDPRVKDLARRVSGAAIWFTGGIAALNTAGVEVASAMATLGVGASLPLGLVASEVIGPSIQGLKLLLNHPFDKGEAVLIDGVPYSFHDMNLMDIFFLDEKGLQEPFEYDKLSGKPITLFKEYDEIKGWIRLKRPTLSVPRLEGRRLLGYLPGWPEVRSFAPSLLTAAGMFVASAFFHAALAASVPYLYAAAIVFGTWLVSKLLNKSLERLEKKQGWDPYAMLALRLLLNLPVWGGGIGWALRAMGVDWAYVLGGLGVTTIVATVAARELLTDYFKKWRYIFGGVFYSGRHVKIGNHEGIVHDIVSRGIVLRQLARFSDGRVQNAYTIVPFSHVKASKITPYDDDRTQDPPEPYLKPEAEK